MFALAKAIPKHYSHFATSTCLLYVRIDTYDVRRSYCKVKDFVTPILRLVLTQAETRNPRLLLLLLLLCVARPLRAIESRSHACLRRRVHANLYIRTHSHCSHKHRGVVGELCATCRDTYIGSCGVTASPTFTRAPSVSFVHPNGSCSLRFPYGRG